MAEYMTAETDTKEYWQQLSEKIEKDVVIQKEKLSDLTKYLKYVKDNSNRKETGRINYYIGKYYFLRSKYEKGLPYIKKAVKYAEQVDDFQTLCDCYNYLSGYHIVKLNEVAAIDCLFHQKKYVVHLQKEKQYPQLFSIYANLAALFDNKNGSKKKALKYYREALRYLRKMGSHNYYYFEAIYINLITLYVECKKYSQAVKYGKQMMSYVQKDKGEISKLQCEVIFLLVRLKENQQNVSPEEINNLYRQLMEKTEPTWFELNAMYKLCPVLMEYGSEEQYNCLLDKMEPFTETMFGLELQRNFWKSRALQYQKIGETEKYQEVCVRLFKLQDKIDEEQAVAKAKSIEQYIAVKEEEYRQVELIRQHEELKKKTNYDELTGIPNRYLLNEFCDEAFAEAIEKHTCISVEVIDVDFFKQMNDNYGHLAGDKCLIAIAGEIKKVVPENGLCARYGGDEFIIVCKNQKDEVLEDTAFLLRHRIMELAIPHAFSLAADVVTISQGIVNQVPQKGQGLKEFIKLADDALYEAKKASKNTVVLKRNK